MSIIYENLPDGRQRQTKACTWLQYVIKNDMGLYKELATEYDDFILKTHFHWKFWRPVDAIGGKVYFGKYVVTSYIVPREEAK